MFGAKITRMFFNHRNSNFRHKFGRYCKNIKISYQQVWTFSLSKCGVQSSTSSPLLMFHERKELGCSKRFFLFNIASITNYKLRELQSLKRAKTNNLKLFILLLKKKKRKRKKKKNIYRIIRPRRDSPSVFITVIILFFFRLINA